jgi:hypothetical protein
MAGSNRVVSRFHYARELVNDFEIGQTVKRSFDLPHVGELCLRQIKAGRRLLVFHIVARDERVIGGCNEQVDQNRFG